jgi:hypothetical protein
MGLRQTLTRREIAPIFKGAYNMARTLVLVIDWLRGLSAAAS